MNSPTSELTLASLLLYVYTRRIYARAKKATIESTLDRAQPLARGHVAWECRLLVEQAHHRSRLYGQADVQARAFAQAALTQVGKLHDPVITGLVMWEATRFDLLDGDQAGVDLEAIAIQIESQLPETYNWGIPAGDVLGHLRIAAAESFGKVGAYEDQLRNLRAIIESAFCSDREIGYAYRQLFSARRKYLDLAGAEAAVEEFTTRVGSLNAEGQAHYHRLKAKLAETEHRWHEAISHRQRAWNLSTDHVGRGNVANGIAYCYTRLDDADGCEFWAKRAESSWDILGRARIGRLVTTRHRAKAAAIRGDWQTAMERAAVALSNTIGPALETWAVTMEILADAARGGASPSILNEVRLRTAAGGYIPAADLQTVADYVVDLRETGKTETLVARIGVSLAVLSMADWIDIPHNLSQRLAESQQWLVESGGWWRAGQCAMARADLARLTGDTHTSALRIKEGFEFWRRHQSRAMGEDHPWLLSHERERFLTGWALAAELGDHSLAVEIAEAGRGAALAAVLSLPVLSGTEIAALTDLHEGITRVLDGGALIALDGGDKDTGDPRGAERAAVMVRATNVRESLDKTVAVIYRMLGTVASAQTERPLDGWTVWVDLHGDQQWLAVEDPSGRSVSLTRQLTKSAALHVAQFADPRTVQAKVSDKTNTGLTRALDELGTPFGEGLIGEALSAATVSSPLTLRICPGGMAWSIPWHAVQVFGEALIKRAEITLVPSKAVAVELERTEMAEITSPVAVFDSSLPGTFFERNALNELWPTVRPFLGDTALRDGGMFVVSAHGDYAAGGLQQRIHVAGREVQATELFSWEFPPFTVFGACWVGRVDAASSGDALGFVFPVLARGARTFIGGLFGIHDEESGKILADVYRGVASGLRPTTALRLSQLDSMGRLGVDAPLAQWAGLSAVGVH